MAASSDSPASSLQIRCPNCAQRFKVDPELRGKMVECGACLHRFRVDDDAIRRLDRVYPGEKKADLPAGQFATAPRIPATLPAGFKTASYERAAPPVQPHGVVSPARLIAGAVGAFVLLLTASLFIFAGDSGGFFQGVDLPRRYLLVGFAGLLAAGCFIFANPNNRLRGILVGIVGLAMMMALPLTFRGVDTPKATVSFEGSSLERPFEETLEQPKEEALEDMGYDVVQRTRAAAGDAADRVMAVWVRDAQERYELQVRDYLVRVADALPYSHLYPRHGGKEFLMVLEEVEISFLELQQKCARLGRVERIFAEERVIEVRLEPGVFVEGSLDQLSDPTHPAFYASNLRELESVNLGRVTRAAERLAGVPPDRFRTDIRRRLVELLSEGDAQFKGKIASTLIHWTEPGDGTAEAALAALQELDAAGEKIPPALMRLLVVKQEPGAIPILDRLWREDGVTWEPIYAKAGPIAEDAALQSFRESEGAQRRSAARILAEVGTRKSLTVLRAVAEEQKDRDLGVAVQKAIAAIEQRES